MNKRFIQRTSRKFVKTNSIQGKSSRDLFLAQIEKIKTANQLVVNKLEGDKLEFCQMAYSAMTSMTREEKDYFFYRYFTENPLMTLDEFQTDLKHNGNVLNLHEIQTESMSFAQSPNKNPERIEAKTPEIKTEETVVKLTCDIEYTGVNPTLKMSAIKEVKAFLNIGLKEAKDIVEGSSYILKQGIKLAEAEEIAKKLTAAGCIIKLK